MELTQAQDDYIFQLVEDWNQIISDRVIKDFVTDELGLAIVTSTAVMVSEMITKQSGDAEIAKIWGFVILGAFLHQEGLLHLGNKAVLQ